MTNPFGAVSGTTTISGDLVVEYNGNGESFNGDTSAFTITGSLGFVFSGNSSYNNGTINADTVEFSGLNTYNNGTIYADTVEFSGDFSYNNNSCTITGDTIFSGLNAINRGTVTGNADFQYTGTLAAGGITNPFGAVSGTTTISGDLVVEYNGNGESFNGSTSGFNISGSLGFVFSGLNTYNNGTIYADTVEFSGSYSTNLVTSTITAPIVRFTGVGSYAMGTITGDVYFEHPSSYPNLLNLTGNAIFKNPTAVEAAFSLNLFSGGNSPFTTNNPTSIKLPFADIVGAGLL